MAHEKHIVDRLSIRLPSLLPEWIQEEAPIFESFLQAYFEFLESEIIVLESQGDLEGIRLEDGTSEKAQSLLLEDGTSPSSPQDSSKILYEQYTSDGKKLDPYKVGEFVFGQTNGSLAKIKVINKNILYVDSIHGTGFAVGETIIGRDGNQTGVVKSYKENSIVANNRLLDYSDIDQTLETFLQYFQKDFIPSLDLRDTQNPRLTLKNIGSLYKQKGTVDSVKFLMRLLYGEDAEIRYPIDETVVLSESQFKEERKLAVQMITADKKPKPTDKIVQYDVNNPEIVSAEAIVEGIGILDSLTDKYSITISYKHRGTFEFGRQVTFVDRDGVTNYTANVLGVLSDIDDTNGSVYLHLEDNNGDILLETGGGMLLEKTSFGSMYDIQDRIFFSGSKLDTDAITAQANVVGLSKGGIERIYIESGGTNYNAGDIVVFDDTTTGGGGAEAVIGAVGDELILENSSATDQYEFVATSNQTVFGGLSGNEAVRDRHGKPVALPPSGDVDVFIDGVLKSESTYSVALDRITFTTNPNLTGGEIVEIVARFNRIIYEDNTPGVGQSPIFLESTDQRIRSVEITNAGAGYEKMPTVFPGGYLYFSDLSGFEVGASVTGGTSNATGTILRIDTDKNRLVIKRASSDTNVFATGELITSGSTSRSNTQAKVSSGTGAKIFAWSSKIGAVEELLITDQGYDFDHDAVIGDSSFHNMLITSPSSSLNKGVTITGVGSGATATIEKYDTQRQILKYTNLNGDFIDDEKVTYNASDSFEILKNNNYTARGKVAGEGLFNGAFLGDRGFISEQNAHIQDSFLYQTHSYVIKVGESINKYRSAVKELVHPAGHIFFGEVAIKSELLSSGLDGRFDVNEDNKLGILSTQFAPTIVMQSFPTDNILLEDSGRDTKNRVLLETGSLLENEDSRDNVATASKETIYMLHTLKTEVDAQDMIFQLRNAQGTNTDIGGGHINVHNRTKFLSSETNSIISNNVTSAFAPTAETITVINQRSPRRDGVLSVSNVVNKEGGYFVPEAGQTISVSNPQGTRGAVDVRPADSGFVIQYYEPNEELLVFEGSTVDEDGNKIGGGRILNEEPLNFLRHEPFDRDLHGHKILLEDDSGTILLEDDTVPEDRECFVTERSIELSNPFLYYESEDRIITEDGSALLKEDAGESVHTFVPIGPTFRTLNKIAFQNCYKISYYILDETSDTNDEDRILMEDGISAILSEESKDEGLSINQLDSVLGNTYINDLDDLRRKRTNIGFSSYVNSSNVTNSTLQSL